MIQDRGKRQLPLDDVYRQLSHPDLSLRAYAKLYTHDGAMTPGITEETVDGGSREKVAKMIEAIRDERWPWTPVKRLLIDKPTGGKRPLGLPVWSEKVVQDIVRSMLEAYDEPQCSTYSHGCRPKRGGHTALHEVGETWTGTKWCIEGDIKGCFDHIDHAILMTILRENIQDHRFLRLIAGALKAGYCEAWTYHPSRSGRPQGGIVSPMLSNSDMDRFDRCVQDTLIPEYTRGIRRKSSREDKRLEGNAHYSRKTGRRERAEARRKVMQQQPSVDPNDAAYRRLRSGRYADDFLLGYAGTRAEARASKDKSAAFVGTPLHLTLSADTTLITHASTGRARFLGYDIGTMHSQTKYDKARRRAVRAKIGLYIPEDVWENKRQRYRRDGKAHHRAARMNESA